MSSFRQLTFIPRLYNVAKWSHDQSLSFRSGIYVPRFFIPNQKLFCLNHTFGTKKAHISPKYLKDLTDLSQIASNKSRKHDRSCDWNDSLWTCQESLVLSNSSKILPKSVKTLWKFPANFKEMFPEECFVKFCTERVKWKVAYSTYTMISAHFLPLNNVLFFVANSSVWYKLKLL